MDERVEHERHIELLDKIPVDRWYYKNGNFNEHWTINYRPDRGVKLTVKDGYSIGKHRAATILSVPLTSVRKLENKWLCEDIHGSKHQCIGGDYLVDKTIRDIVFKHGMWML